MLLRGVVEGLGFIVIVPLLASASVFSSNQENVWFSEGFALLQEVIDFNPSFSTVGLAFLAIMTMRSGIGYFSSTLSARYNALFVSRARSRVHEAITRARWTHTLSSSEARNTFALTDQVEYLETLVAQTLQLLSSTITILVGIGIALIVSAEITVVILLLLFLMAISMIAFQFEIYRRGETLAQYSLSLYDLLISRLGVTKLIKGLSYEKEIIDAFDKNSQDLSQGLYCIEEISARANLLQNMLAAVILITVIYLALFQFSLSEAQLLLVCIIFARLAPLMISFQYQLRSLAAAMPEYEMLRKVEADAVSAGEQPPQTDHCITPRERITLRNVWFSYPGRSTQTGVQDVSVDIAPHRTTGIMGLSGAGKSTIVDIVSGLMSPTAGKLLVDSVEIDAANRVQWRDSLTYVPQDAPLFHGSIRSNLMCHHLTCSDKDIWRALEAVGADRVIANMADGLDTLVGDNGFRLSGGERQRLRIASALIRKPSLLILDEATSALNAIDEASVVGNLKTNLGDITLIIVTHRPSTVIWMDDLIIMENGQIAETGAPGDLIRKKGSFLNEMANTMLKFNNNLEHE